MKNITALLDYLERTGFLRKPVGEYLEDFISRMQIEDIDEIGLLSLKKELNINCFKPIDLPQCHWLTGVFKQNRLILVANAILKLQDVSSEELDRMVWVYLKINERLELIKPV